MVVLDDPAGPVAEERDTTRVAFQDGLLPSALYAGTRDAAIKNGPTEEIRGGNFGTAALDTLGTREAGDGFFESRVLVRFDLASLTNCWYVVSADLAVWIESVDEPFVASLYETTVPGFVPGTWAEGTGGAAGGVSWNTIDGLVPWNVQGGDTAGGAIAQATVAPGDTAAVFTLPASLVQSWISIPASNHGVALRAAYPAPGASAVVRMRESGDPARRPALSIVYIRYG